MSGESLRLSAGNPDRDSLIVGRIVIVLDDAPVEFELVVPDGKVAFEDTLAVVQGLTDFVVELGTAATEAAGEVISCRAGCGACCRQIVPVSQAEARALVQLVDAMPEPRRSLVRERFYAALETCDANGLLADIDEARAEEAGSVGDIGMRYFRQGLACPFLEYESCSIHSDRPVACREYLVTSPARNCENPSPATISTVILPARPSQALLLADSADSRVTWMPLVYALTYVEQVPPQRPGRTAPDILRDIFSRLGGGGFSPLPARGLAPAKEGPEARTPDSYDG